jgi:hypothetical protein
MGRPPRSRSALQMVGMSLVIRTETSVVSMLRYVDVNVPCVMCMRQVLKTARPTIWRTVSSTRPKQHSPDSSNRDRQTGSPSSTMQTGAAKREAHGRAF